MPEPLILWGPQFLYSPALLEVISKQDALTVLAQSLQDTSPEIRVASLQGLGNILFHAEKVRARLPCSHKRRVGKVQWVGTLALSPQTYFRRGHPCSPGTQLFTLRRDGPSCTTQRPTEKPGRQNTSPGTERTPLENHVPLIPQFSISNEVPYATTTTSHIPHGQPVLRKTAMLCLGACPSPTPVQALGFWASCSLQEPCNEQQLRP